MFPTIIVGFLPTFLFANSVGTPLMSTNILQASKAKAPLQHQCHEFELPKIKLKNNNSKIINTDYFEADISCDYNCSGEKKLHTKTIVKKFSPAELGLYQGDGTSDKKILWRSLGTTINVWSKKQCFELASVECKSIEKFSVSRITSGDWNFKGDYNCQRKDTIYSPFDDNKTLNNAKVPPTHRSLNTTHNLSDFPMNPTQSSFRFELTSRKINEDQLKELIKDEKDIKCKNAAQVYTCFGDCVFENETRKWIETLSTNEYFGDYGISVCLDPFQDQFKETDSKDVKDYKCHKLLWEIFLRTDMMGTSCAAFRFDYTCPF